MLQLQLLVRKISQLADSVSKLCQSWHLVSLVCCAQDVGDEPYQASVMKITGNFFIVSCVETIAEGMTLAEKNGISRCVDTETSYGPASCCLLAYAAQSKQLQVCHLFASLGTSSRLRCFRLYVVSHSVL